MNYYEALTEKKLAVEDIDAAWREFLYGRHDNDYDMYEWWTSMSLFLRREAAEPELLMLSANKLMAFLSACGVSNDAAKQFIKNNSK